MGKRPSYAIDVPSRSLCSALTWKEWGRFIDKVGLDDAVDLRARVRERDRMLEAGVKSVPKHRKNPKGPRLP